MCINFGLSVELTYGTSGCDKCVGPVDIVIGCGQWVVDLLDYLIINYPIPLVSVLVASSTLSVQ